MIVTLTIATITLSIALGLAVWYVRGLLRVMYQMTVDVQQMEDKMVEFSKHLNNVYEMEMFYGDDTLQGLIEHTKFIIDEIKGFEEIYSLTVDEENVDDDETLQA